MRSTECFTFTHYIFDNKRKAQVVNAYCIELPKADSGFIMEHVEKGHFTLNAKLT